MACFSPSVQGVSKKHLSSLHTLAGRWPSCFSRFELGTMHGVLTCTHLLEGKGFSYLLECLLGSTGCTGQQILPIKEIHEGAQ